MGGREAQFADVVDAGGLADARDNDSIGQYRLPIRGAGDRVNA
jgi:hypothetical protein